MQHSMNRMNRRFRSFMPVVIDVETGGTDPIKNPVLEVAAVFLKLDRNGIMHLGSEFCDHIVPFPGSIIEQEALDINQIDPDYPLRFPRPEKDVMKDLFNEISKKLEYDRCKRGVLVGHNAHFDLSFIRQASTRCKLEDLNPLHAFSVLDTVTIGAVAYGQTILSMACDRAGIDFCGEDAHSAIYDARKTAELFCKVINKWTTLGGWGEAVIAQEKYLERNKNN